MQQKGGSHGAGGSFLFFFAGVGGGVVCGKEGYCFFCGLGFALSADSLVIMADIDSSKAAKQAFSVET